MGAQIDRGPAPVAFAGNSTVITRVDERSHKSAWSFRVHAR